MRHVLMIVVLAVAAVSIYSYLHKGASEVVKRQLTAIVDDMGLSPEWTAEVRTMIDRLHDDCFARAMDVSRRLGTKFDERSYYDDIFDRITGDARGLGMTELADKLEDERQYHILTVTEH